MLELFKEKTGSLRKQIVFSVARTLSPSLYDVLLDNDGFVGHVPRPFTLMLQKEFKGKALSGVEIGFGAGENAASILELLNIKKLFCVDPFIGKQYSEGGKVLGNYAGLTSQYLRLKEMGNVEFVELTSDEACKTLPNHLDFVYIDGVHTHEQVFSDLQNYYSLLGIDGFVGGHDFQRGCPRVIDAVFDFAVALRKTPVISMPDFWFSAGTPK